MKITSHSPASVTCIFVLVSASYSRLSFYKFPYRRFCYHNDSFYPFGFPEALSSSPPTLVTLFIDSAPVIHSV
jgi:hypothetical protein